jgi:hypothetical protein
MDTYRSDVSAAQPVHVYVREALRLEAVITSVGFDDMLDATLSANMAHLDTMIVVTSHDDRATNRVARKHGAICVQTDLFGKNARSFNKGAAINVGMDRFQYHGWRLVMDADIALPDSFRRILFNHSHLEQHCIYGADRVDVIGLEELAELRQPQHDGGLFVMPGHHRPLSPRYVDHLRGYVPLGFFQLYHASCQKSYPWSLGTAAHDDVMFAASWPESSRRLLPGVIVYHLCSVEPSLGQNWEGRKQPRLDGNH